MTPGEENRDDTSPAGPLVLVVDDFEDSREMLAEYLDLAGFRVAEASDGREALSRAFSILPDIVVMDMSLPEIDGWEATRILRADPRTRHVPVVALTGHALAEHWREAKEAGCDAFLTKPCLPDQLVAEIRRLLAREDRDADPDAPDFQALAGRGKPG